MLTVSSWSPEENKEVKLKQDSELKALIFLGINQLQSARAGDWLWSQVQAALVQARTQKF